MTNAPAKKPGPPWGLIVPWALFALIAGGYFAYWSVLRAEAIRQIDAAIAAERAKGAEAAYAKVSTDGFPLRLSLRFAEVQFAPAGANWRLATEKLSIHVNPINLFHVIAAADAPISRIAADGATHVFNAPKAALSVRVGADGRLARASLEVEELLVTRTGAPDGGTRIAGLVAHLRPDVRDAARWQIAAEVREARLPRPAERLERLGTSLPSARLAASLPGAGQDPFAGLAEGPAQIDVLEVSWGPMALAGSGALGLDAQRRLNGALTVTLQNPSPTLAALGLSDLAAATPAQSSVQFALETRNGVLMAGPHEVLRLEPLF